MEPSAADDWTRRDLHEFVRGEVQRVEEKAKNLIDHKTAKVGILAENVANHVRDLSRNPADPGWVKVAIDNEERVRLKSLEDERAARKRTAEELAEKHNAADEAIIARVQDLEVALGEDGWVKRAFAAQNKKLNGILVAVGLSALGLIGNLLLKLADLATRGAG